MPLYNPSTSSSSNIVVTAVKTSAYTAGADDGLILADASSATFSITLPTAVGVSGKIYRVKRVDQTLANSVTVVTTSSQTIDGALTKLLATQYEEIDVVSDGSNWQILNRRIPQVWFDYTPTFTGFGTAASVSLQWSRVGCDILIRGRFAAGTPTTVEARMSLPSGLTSVGTGSSEIPSIQSTGSWMRDRAAGTRGSFLLIEPNSTYLTFGQGEGFANGTGNGLPKMIADSYIAPGDTVYINFFRCPINGWEDV